MLQSFIRGMASCTASRGCQVMCGHSKYPSLNLLQTLKTHPLSLKTNAQPQPAKHGLIHVCTDTPLRSLMRLARAGAGCLGAPVLCGSLPRPPCSAFPAPVLMSPLAPLPWRRNEWSLALPLGPWPEVMQRNRVCRLPNQPGGIIVLGEKNAAAFLAIYMRKVP